MISTLRPSIPPAALIESTANCAPLLIPVPLMADSSTMIPILIGSFDCAWAAPASKQARGAAIAAMRGTVAVERSSICDLPCTTDGDLAVCQLDVRSIALVNAQCLRNGRVDESG